MKFIPYHYPSIFDRTLQPARESQGVVCVLLCATALEALIHDIIGWYTFVSKNSIRYSSNDHPADNYLKPEEKELLRRLVKTENSRLSVEEKFGCIATWESSKQPYQDFKKLISIRNSIAHLKPEELEAGGSEGHINGYPKLLNDFFQSRIIDKPEKIKSWIELIETNKFCVWCQESAYNMASATIEALPNTVTKQEFSKEISFPFRPGKP